MKINLYLDIDGVLNAPTANMALGQHMAWPEYRELAPYTLTAPAMIEQLNATIERHGINVYWATTWESEAPEFGKRVGLAESENWPWLSTRDRDRKWGKFVSVREHWRADQPDAAIWIDDDLSDEHAATLWAARLGILALAPTNQHGITPAMLTQINHHIARNREEA